MLLFVLSSSCMVLPATDLSESLECHFTVETLTGNEQETHHFTALPNMKALNAAQSPFYFC